MGSIPRGMYDSMATKLGHIIFWEMVGLTLWKGCRGDDHTKGTSWHTKVLQSFQKDQGSNDQSTISQKKEIIIWKPNGKSKGGRCQEG
jgi:hypothetical protein